MPGVRCPDCGYPNDHTFHFCQMCGYRRQSFHPCVSSIAPVDVSTLDNRLHELKALSLSTAYSKQKLSLKNELESFLFSLPGHKSLSAAMPIDVCRFLAWKDKDGKTKVHKVQCAFRGQKGASRCNCPPRLSYNTVDSYIGKLQAVFKSIGRQSDWDVSLGLGKPGGITSG